MKDQMTPQEIFDTVAEHLFSKGGPALDEGENCVYRTPDGRMCAVGRLISDELAALGNGASVMSLIQRAKDKEIKVPEWLHENESLLTDL